MSWFSENIVNPIENVGNALFHGDITGGQYQASGSDWLKAGGTAATIATLGLAAPEVAGAVGLGDVAAGAGTAVAADAAPAASFGFEDAVAGAGADPSLFGGAAAGGDTSALGLAGPVADPGAGTPFAGGSTGVGPTSIPGVGGDTSLDSLAMGNAGTQPLNLTPGTTPTATPAAGGGGVSGAWDTLTSPSKWTLGGVVQGAGLAAAGVGLGSALLKSNTPPPGSQNLTNTAGAGAATFQQQAAIGAQLEGYLANGTLPAPQQAQIDALVRAQKAKVISGYAARGQSTQPGTNSALDQDLAAVDQQGLVMAANMESELFTNGQQALATGLNGLGISQASYTTLAQMDQTQNNQLNSAIANFAGAAAGKTTINLGGTKAA